MQDEASARSNESEEESLSFGLFFGFALSATFFAASIAPPPLFGI
jgi:hypothetical protein